MIAWLNPGRWLLVGIVIAALVVGLPLAKRLVERHDGTLTLSSTVGLGTTVTVWLPSERAVSQASVA